MGFLVLCLVLLSALHYPACARRQKFIEDEDERILAIINSRRALRKDEIKDPIDAFEEKLMLAEAAGPRLNLTEIAVEDLGVQTMPSGRKSQDSLFKRLSMRATSLFNAAKKKAKAVKSKLERIGESLSHGVIRLINTFKSGKVCYEPYGCFTNHSPFNNVWNLLPKTPREIGTEFVLYTRENSQGVTISISSVSSTDFSNDKETIFIIHGWTEGHKTSWIKKMKDKLLERNDVNVIGVYWEDGAKANYFQAVGNTRLVGAQVAYVIERLHTESQLSFDKVHLIGFSLGAQTAGYAGQTLREKGHTISRITGLDPAGPAFASQPTKVRLDPSDAAFVDVIHTSYLYLVGIKERSGHVDFYVNGGGAQPGCLTELPPVCSHSRAVKLFIESIQSSCSYRAYKCSRYIAFRLGFCKDESSADMGYDVSKTANGKFYVVTSGTEPYCPE